MGKIFYFLNKSNLLYSQATSLQLRRLNNMKKDTTRKIFERAFSVGYVSNNNVANENESTTPLTTTSPQFFFTSPSPQQPPTYSFPTPQQNTLTLQNTTTLQQNASSPMQQNTNTLNQQVLSSSIVSPHDQSYFTQYSFPTRHQQEMLNQQQSENFSFNTTTCPHCNNIVVPNLSCPFCSKNIKNKNDEDNLIKFPQSPSFEVTPPPTNNQALKTPPVSSKNPSNTYQQQSSTQQQPSSLSQQATLTTPPKRKLKGRQMAACCSGSATYSPPLCQAKPPIDHETIVETDR